MRLPRSAPYQLTTAGRSYLQKAPASTAEHGLTHEDISRASLLHERDHANGATPQQVYASLWAARLIELAPPPPGAPANWILLRRTITGDLALDDAVDRLSKALRRIRSPDSANDNWPSCAARPPTTAWSASATSPWRKQLAWRICTARP